MVKSFHQFLGDTNPSGVRKHRPEHADLLQLSGDLQASLHPVRIGFPPPGFPTVIRGPLDRQQIRKSHDGKPTSYAGVFQEVNTGNVIAHGVGLLCRSTGGGRMMCPALSEPPRYAFPGTRRPFVYSPKAFVISSSDMTAAEGAAFSACSVVAGRPRLRLGTGSAAFAGAARVCSAVDCVPRRRSRLLVDLSIRSSEAATPCTPAGERCLRLPGFWQEPSTVRGSSRG